jgi:hypothetical protein
MARAATVAVADVVDLQPDEIASAQLVVFAFAAMPDRPEPDQQHQAPMDTKQIHLMAPEIYRWSWSDRSRGDKRFWKTGIDGVAMRGGI